MDEVNNKLSDCQNVFCLGHSTIDHLTTLTSIVECGKSQRKAFIDLRKAYDKVDRQKLWYKLRALLYRSTTIPCHVWRSENILRTGLRLIEGSDRDVICHQHSPISLLMTWQIPSTESTVAFNVAVFRFLYSCMLTTLCSWQTVKKNYRKR